MLDLNLLHLQLNIDAARWTANFHQAIRETIEQHLGNEWSVTKIKGENATQYATGLAQDILSRPKSILTEVQATFEIEAVNLFLGQMFITAKLISNGKLMITQVRR